MANWGGETFICDVCGQVKLLHRAHLLFEVTDENGFKEFLTFGDYAYINVCIECYNYFLDHRVEVEGGRQFRITKSELSRLRDVLAPPDVKEPDVGD